MQTNRIKHFIERRLLMPSYAVMLAGLLVRSVALVLSAAIPYDTWPLALRILVEAFAALGMIGCADIVLSASAARKAQLDRQMDAMHNAPEYEPNTRLAGERYTREKTLLDAKRARALAGLANEARKEWYSVLFGAGVTVSYGILFALTVLKHASFVSIAVEVIGVSAIPFVTWYLSAQYREEQAEPDESAKALALESVEQRLGAAKDRFRRGEEHDQDVQLLEVATEASPYHRKLVAALRRPDTTVVYLSTPEIYKLLGVYDSTGQATIRRIVRRAGEKHESGVIADAKTGAWRTPKASLIDLFPQFIGVGISVDAPASVGRTRASKGRTRSVSQPAQAGALSEQGSAQARTALGPADALPPFDGPTPALTRPADEQDADTRLTLAVSA